MEIKSFDKPDETRMFEGKGMADIVMVAGRPIARGHFEPGWRWSVNVKPIAQTELCEVSHFGYVEQGKMRIHMQDGSEQDIAPGQVVAIPAGRLVRKAHVNEARPAASPPAPALVLPGLAALPVTLPLFELRGGHRPADVEALSDRSR